MGCPHGRRAFCLPRRKLPTVAASIDAHHASYRHRPRRRCLPRRSRPKNAKIIFSPQSSSGRPVAPAIKNNKPQFFHHRATEHTESAHCAERAQWAHSCRRCRELHFFLCFYYSKRYNTIQFLRQRREGALPCPGLFIVH